MSFSDANDDTRQRISELERRSDDLESQLAFQEETIDALNQLVTKQNQELQTLQKHFVLLVERMQQMRDSQDQQPVDERPPHY